MEGIGTARERPRFVPILFVVLLAATPASAQQQHPTDYEYLQQVEQILDQSSRSAATWQDVWATVYAVQFMRSVYLGRLAEGPERFDGNVNAIKSFLFLSELMANPPPHAMAQARVKRLLEDPHDNMRFERRRAEIILEEAAREERARHGFSARGHGLAVNLAAALVIGYGDNRKEDALNNFVTGMVVNELKLLTQPRSASRGWQKYKKHILQFDAGTLHVEYAWMASLDELAVRVRW